MSTRNSDGGRGGGALPVSSAAGRRNSIDVATDAAAALAATAAAGGRRFSVSLEQEIAALVNVGGVGGEGVDRQGEEGMYPSKRWMLLWFFITLFYFGLYMPLRVDLPYKAAAIVIFPLFTCLKYVAVASLCYPQRVLPLKAKIALSFIFCFIFVVHGSWLFNLYPPLTAPTLGSDGRIVVPSANSVLFVLDFYILPWLMYLMGRTSPRSDTVAGRYIIPVSFLIGTVALMMKRPIFTGINFVQACAVSSWIVFFDKLVPQTRQAEAPPSPLTITVQVRPKVSPSPSPSETVDGSPPPSSPSSSSTTTISPSSEGIVADPSSPIPLPPPPFSSSAGLSSPSHQTSASRSISYSWVYLCYFMFLSTTVGVFLGVIFAFQKHQSVLSKAIAMQIFVSIVFSVFTVSAKRSTDNAKFGILMLMGYFQVDFFQSAFYLVGDEMLTNPKTFVYLVMVQEIFGVLKTAGGAEYFSYLLKWRSTSPFSDLKTIRMLHIKALVDSLSEIVSCIGVPLLWLVESKLAPLLKTGAKHSVQVSAYAVETTGPFWKSTTVIDYDEPLWSYETNFCAYSCVGWRVENGHPPTDSKTVGYVFKVYAIVLLVRLVFLFAELKLLVFLQKRVQGRNVAPEAGEEPQVPASSFVQARRNLKVVGTDTKELFEKVPLFFLVIAFHSSMLAVTLGIYSQAWAYPDAGILPKINVA